jgi:HK97 family phage prohead protease
MPAEECKNGMWKWGETGECKYESQAEAEEDNEDYYEKDLNKKEIKNIWDKKYNNIMEKRIYNVETRVETTEDNKEVVVGYGSIFNSRSENLGGFYEYIAPEAITSDTIVASDVRALINHDPNLILARSKNGDGNLKLSVDETGLRYEFNIPETSYGKDLAINLKNGNISQSSFAFTIAKDGDNWTTDAEGRDIRTITKIDRLYDISSVTYPAYNDASSDLVIAQRGLQTYKESQKIKEEEKDLVTRSLAKLKIEIAKRKK